MRFSNFLPDLRVCRLPRHNSPNKFIRGTRSRKLICFVLLLNLLIWPTPGVAREFGEVASSAVVSSTVTLTTGSLRMVSYLLKALFGAQSPRRKDNPADRERAVAALRVNPNKLVGYENEGATFTALPTDLLGRTVQGTKASWSSSDTRTIQIDEAGRARFLAPGIAWVTCSVGAVTGTAPVLVRSSHRPRQTDDEWRADQATLRPDGTLIGDGRQPSDDGSLKRVASAVSSVLDKLAPTVLAQGPPYPNDLGYDELWSDPRNLVGSPRDRAVEPMPFGSVLPEGSNFEWGVPIYGLGGRGLAANLMLYYNSRVWSRRGTTMAYDAISGWPAPGFSLGFGRIVPYEIGSGGNPSCKYLLIERDGTRRYLGSGLYNGYGYALGGPFETSDGSHIVYTGNGRDGGDLLYPDGTKVSYTTTNNRVLPTTITDRNGNYLSRAPDNHSYAE